jgi:sarcosine oxidase, subunit gamma
MAETLSRSEPVPAEVFVGRGVTIALAPPMARFALRARQAVTLESVLGMPVPQHIGSTTSDLACLGPDEWLLRAPAGTSIPTSTGQAVAVTDISERSICLTVTGPRAAALLMTGCPIDFDHFAVGRATRTLYETVEIMVIREAEDRFQVEVWRSFAVWLWTALTMSAQH